MMWCIPNYRIFRALYDNVTLIITSYPNYGDSFLDWIRVFYSDISSCIMNDGFSDTFEVNRGVSQGDLCDHTY